VVKPVAGRTGDGESICEACRRQRGRCGKTPSIAVRVRDDEPDIRVNCPKGVARRLPSRPGSCVRCGRHARLRPTRDSALTHQRGHPSGAWTAPPPAVAWEAVPW